MTEPAFFRQITQLQTSWQDGAVPLPTFYRDAMAVHPQFLAPSGRVRSVLPSPPVHPLRSAPGRCTVAVAALSFRDTDPGPYDEALVGIPFTLDDRSPQVTGILRSLPEVAKASWNRPSAGASTSPPRETAICFASAGPRASSASGCRTTARMPASS